MSIADGDTFTLLTKDNAQIKIRLYGIDCPEKNQDFGQAAKKYISDLIFKSIVYIEDKGLDRYGRTLGVVFKDTMNINETMLKEGYAWHYVYFDKNELWDAYESEARQLKKGLWSQQNATPPWNWRRMNK